MTTPMRTVLSCLLAGAITMSLAVCNRAGAQQPGGMAPPDIDRAVAELLSEEAAAPTNASNVSSRYQKMVSIMKAMIQRHLPADQVLPPEEGMRLESLIRSGNTDQAAHAVADAIRALGKMRQNGQIPRGQVQQDPGSAAPQQFMTPSGNGQAVVGQPSEYNPGSGVSPDIGQAVSDLLKDEAVSPTSSANVTVRYQKLVGLAMKMIQNHLPVNGVLPAQEGRNIDALIRNGNLEQAAHAVKEAINRLKAARQLPAVPQQNTLPEMQQHRNIASRQNGVAADRGLDADGFLWGTEVYPSYIESVAMRTLANTLPMRYLKVRIMETSFSTEDGKTFLPAVCLPSPANCVVKYDMDAVARTFRENGWSMIPMISHDHVKPVTSEDIVSYVNFVDWFVSRYKNDADIRYLELINAPVMWWKGSTAQLAELQNKVYERIKGKYPDIMVGTPGFEYWVDIAQQDKSIQEITYFLDKRNYVKFDFWAFHGYPGIDYHSLVVNKTAAFYPPTKTGLENKYLGPAGILEIRKILDSNGWTDRPMIDTEHTNIMSRATPFVSDEEDILDAAYTVQELLIKRTLLLNGQRALRGIFLLKIGPRGREEFSFASMKPDGSETRTVRAVGLLLSQLKGFHYSSHISGEFDKENQVWVERFRSGARELFVYFKPFLFQKGRSVALDGQTVHYALSLRQKPVSIVLTDESGNTKRAAPSQSIVLDAVNAPRFIVVTYE
jgi:hypothetical protein